MAADTAAAGPAAAAAPATVAAPAAGSDNPDVQAPLTQTEVEAQVKQAEKLRADLAKQNAAVAQAEAALEKAAAESTASMEKLASARRTLQAAEAEEKTQQTRLRQITASLNAAKKDVRSMAVDAYTGTAGPLDGLAAIISVVTGSEDELSNAALASYLADSRAADKDKFTSLATQQQQVAAQAGEARLAREKAAQAAEAAKTETEAKVAAQRAALTAMQADAAATASNIATTEAEIAAATKAREEAAALAAANAAAAEKLARESAATGDTAAAAAASVAQANCADDTGTYPNGQFPSSAMCKLETAPQHMLRPAAAVAFDRMSRAYKEETGSYLCITDSYRSLAAQIDVRKRKPTLAAVPGTSNHGLGLAVDLCGGIESFGTPAYQWMKQRAPLFGFFHPSWAEPTGSKPEPWHWEFAG